MAYQIPTLQIISKISNIQTNNIRTSNIHINKVGINLKEDTSIKIQLSFKIVGLITQDTELPLQEEPLLIENFSIITIIMKDIITIIIIKTILRIITIKIIIIKLIIISEGMIMVVEMILEVVMTLVEIMGVGIGEKLSNKIQK